MPKNCLKHLAIEEQENTDRFCSVKRGFGGCEHKH